MNHKFNNKPKYMRTININVSKQQVAEIVAKTEWAQPKTNPPTWMAPNNPIKDKPQVV